LAPEKNPETLIAAYEAARQRDPRARLVLVGDGPARRELQQRCPGALFAGVRHGRDLAEHYASGDVFLVPSLTETYGNVTVEALASGLAVVAYDYGAAAAHVRDGSSGLLAPVADASAFVSLAAGLAGSRERIVALGAGARQAALGLGWERVVRQLEATLEAAAGHARVTCGEYPALVQT
jgi:glycosyltransferase involved in cell wall biosynthesis